VRQPVFTLEQETINVNYLNNKRVSPFTNRAPNPMRDFTRAAHMACDNRANAHTHSQSAHIC